MLVTNLDQSYTVHEVLKQYKAQSKVKTSFKLLERRVREAMKAADESLIIPGKVKSFTLPAKEILDSLEMVLTMTTNDLRIRAFSKRLEVPGVHKLTNGWLRF